MINSDETYRIFEEQYGTNHTAKYKEQPGWIRILSLLSKNRLDAVSELLPDRKLSVLDIGCGDGSFLWKNRNLWNSLTGVDVIASQLTKARKRRYGCAGRFINRDFGRTRMPFASGNFDVCVSIATLQYVYDLELLFSEVHRVLKPAGLWIFEVPNIAVFWRRLEFLWGHFPQTSQFHNNWDAGTIHYYTFGNVYKFCRRNGFHVNSVTTSGIFSSIRSFWPSLLGADLIFTCSKEKS